MNQPGNTENDGGYKEAGPGEKGRKSPALLGLKHSGKSSVAERLSNRLSLPCLDTDRLVSHEAGCDSARETFKAVGRARFRDLEERVCSKLARRAENERIVLATGGGLADNEEALAILSQEFYLIYLLDSEQVLYDRFMKGGRPAFLPQKNTREAWSQIYRRRDRCCRRWADRIVDCRRRTVAEITEIAYESFIHGD